MNRIQRDANKKTPKDIRRDLLKKTEEAEREAFELRVLLGMLEVLDLIDEKGTSATSGELRRAAGTYERGIGHVMLGALRELEQMGIVKENTVNLMKGEVYWEVVEQKGEEKP